MRRPARRLLLRPAVLLAAVACVAGVVPAGAQETAAGIDVLQASREEVRQELAALDARIAARTAAVADAQAAVDLARAAVGRAEARVDLARNEVEIARDRVRAYAVEAYVRPPAADALAVLSIRQTEEAANISNLLKIMAERRAGVVDVMVARQADLEKEQQAATAAKVQAEAKLDGIRSELDALKALYADQTAVAVSLDERLNAALAEAAALAAVDREMADQLVAEEVALREAAPPTPDPAPGDAADDPGAVRTAPTTAPDDQPTTTAPAGSGTPGTSGPGGVTTTTVRRTTTTLRPTTSTTARPRTSLPPPPSNLPSWSDMTSVGGIYVAASVAGRVRGLLNAATAAGVSLRGGGYRSSASQITLRQAHCGPTAYDVYQKPASQCRPPTARPGSSMHERGLAIDFTYNGSIIASRTNPGYLWLKANAAAFGFYNLPSEPWHWSVNGN